MSAATVELCNQCNGVVGFEGHWREGICGGGFMCARRGGTRLTRMVEIAALSARDDLDYDLGPFDRDELARWAESYGHPEGWVQRAQAAHMRAENAAKLLERHRGLFAELDAFLRWCLPRDPELQARVAAEVAAI